jgi:hypothetical protein
MDGIVHICYIKTDFNCPECGHKHTEDDYYERLRDSKRFLIYQQCKNKMCREKLGISSDIKGDVVVWLKREEPKYPPKHNF